MTNDYFFPPCIWVSIEAEPPPWTSRAAAMASSAIGYSNPPEFMKKPDFQCTAMIAVSITQEMKKAPIRVYSPIITIAPPTNSDRAAAPIHSHDGRISWYGAG